jgi:hypothetical protein
MENCKREDENQASIHRKKIECIFFFIKYRGRNKIPKSVINLIQMDVGGLPPIPTGSFWQFSSLAVFS